MDDHGAGVRKFSLLSVDLGDETDDSTWLLRDPVVGPAHVLVVPYWTGKTGLGAKKQNKTSQHIKKGLFKCTCTKGSLMFSSCIGTICSWLLLGHTGSIYLQKLECACQQRCG